MKTAMQQLIYFMENGGAGSDNPFELKRYAKLLLEKEKEQIMDAYLKNHLQGCWMEKSAEEFAEQYYNETFKSE